MMQQKSCQNVDESKRKHDDDDDDDGAAACYEENLLPFKKRARLFLFNKMICDQSESSAGANNDDRREEVRSEITPVASITTYNTGAGSMSLPAMRNSREQEDDDEIIRKDDFVEEHEAGGGGGKSSTPHPPGSVESLQQGDGDDDSNVDGVPASDDDHDGEPAVRDDDDANYDGDMGDRKESEKMDEEIENNEGGGGGGSEPVGDGANYDGDRKESDKMEEEIENNEGGGSNGSDEPHEGGDHHKDGGSSTIADDGKLADGIKEVIDYEGANRDGICEQQAEKEKGGDEKNNSSEPKRQGQSSDDKKLVDDDHVVSSEMQVEDAGNDDFIAGAPNVEGISNTHPSPADTTLMETMNCENRQGDTDDHQELGQIDAMEDRDDEIKSDQSAEEEENSDQGIQLVENAASTMNHGEGGHDYCITALDDVLQVHQADPVTNLDQGSSNHSLGRDGEQGQVAALVEAAGGDEKNRISELGGGVEEIYQGKKSVEDAAFSPMIHDGASEGGEAESEGGHDHSSNYALDILDDGKIVPELADPVTNLEGSNSVSPADHTTIECKNDGNSDNAADVVDNGKQDHEADTTVEFKVYKRRGRSETESHEEEEEVAAVMDVGGYENIRISEPGEEMEIDEDQKAVDDVVSTMVHDEGCVRGHNPHEGAADSKDAKQVHEADFATKHEGSSRHTDSLGDDAGPSVTTDQMDYHRPRPTRTPKKPNWMKDYIRYY